MHYYCFDSTIIIRVKRLRSLILFLSFIGLSMSSFAQESSNTHVYQGIISTESIRLDSLSIYPSSFKINNLDKGKYFINYVTAEITFLDSTLIGKPFTAEYKTFDYNLGEKRNHKSTSIIEPRWKPYAQQIVPIQSTSISHYEDESDLSYDGVIARGVSVGNNQDLALNSTLNFRIAGQLAKGLTIEANITDQNIPIQPEGNTRVIQDFDQIFIKLNYKNQFLLNAGDIDIIAPNDKYLYLTKRILGIEFIANNQLDEKNHLYNKVGVGIAKGKFTRNEITAINGVQGPYRLTGEQNETAIVIIAGSERVYINGELLTRGQEHDYTIDYNTGEISFTSKRLISTEKRIIVEFEYSDRYYSRVTAYSFNEFTHEKISKLKLNVNFYHEQDLKNRSIQPELNDDQKRFLSGIGDPLNKALYPNADSVAFNSSEILYSKRDTLVDGTEYSIYQYSINPADAFYRVVFSYVGDNAGNYVLAQSTANGKVYQWVAPKNGIKQGCYEPATTLATPKLVEMGTIAAQYEFNKQGSIKTEFAFSNYDQNLFSKKDDKDNIGFAYFLEAQYQKEINNERSSYPWLFRSKINYDLIHKNFHTIERYRDVEFNRDYNLENNNTQVTEHLLEAAAYLSNSKVGNIDYTLNYLSQYQLRNIIKNSISSSLHSNGYQFITNTSYLYSSDSIQKTHFARSFNQLSKTFKKIEIGVKDDLEYNVFKEQASNSLRANSYAYNEIIAYIKNNDSLPYLYNIYFKHRLNDEAEQNHLSVNSIIYEASASFELAKLKHNRLRANATYRHTQLKDSTYRFIADNNVVGSIEYSGKFFKNAITLNTYYEMGQGLEAKKNFSFLKVAAGQGTHTWKDYNGNGIEELDEFELAAYQDEANYIKVWLPSHDYETVFNHQFSQTLQLRPYAVWSRKKGFLKFLSRFSETAMLRISQKNSAQDVKDAWVPFKYNIHDTTQVSSNTLFKNTLSFNQNSSKFGIDYIAQINQTKSLLYNGFDICKNKIQEVILRGSPIQNLILKTDYQYQIKENCSEYSLGKNFKVQSHQTTNTISMHHKNGIFWSLTYIYKHKYNIVNNEISNQHQAEGNLSYRLANKGNFDFNMKYVHINYKGEINSSVGYEILEGLQPGNNLVWTSNIQFQITNFLELDLQYEGRASQKSKTIHSGTLQVRAHF